MDDLYDSNNEYNEFAGVAFVAAKTVSFCSSPHGVRKSRNFLVGFWTFIGRTKYLSSENEKLEKNLSEIKLAVINVEEAVKYALGRKIRRQV